MKFILLGCIVTAIYIVWKRNSRTHKFHPANSYELTLAHTIHDNLASICRELGISKIFSVKLHRKESYTEDNRSIYIKAGCNGELYDMNTLMHVAIHELTHVLITSSRSNREHDSSFKELQAILEEVAERLGIYNPSMAPGYEFSCAY
jgi:hypothetical protein